MYANNNFINAILGTLGSPESTYPPNSASSLGQIGWIAFSNYLAKAKGPCANGRFPRQQLVVFAWLKINLHNVCRCRPECCSTSCR